jgi:hypothetical protein
MIIIMAAHDGAARPGRGRATRHRLTVLATDAAEAVSGAGGLIFDRVRTGWQVEVYLAVPGDERPLHILGVGRGGPLPASFGRPAEWPDALVIGGELYDGNKNVCRFFAAASRSLLTEVAIWGGRWPAELAAGVGRVEHRLSTAARAFKAHALQAAGAPPQARVTESFHSGARRFSIAAPLLPPELQARCR